MIVLGISKSIASSHFGPSFFFKYYWFLVCSIPFDFSILNCRCWSLSAQKCNQLCPGQEIASKLHRCACSSVQGSIVLFFWARVVLNCSVPLLSGISFLSDLTACFFSASTTTNTNNAYLFGPDPMGEEIPLALLGPDGPNHFEKYLRLFIGTLFLWSPDFGNLGAGRTSPSWGLSRILFTASPRTLESIGLPLSWFSLHPPTPKGRLDHRFA